MSFTVGVSMATITSAASRVAVALVALMLATNDLQSQGPVSGQVSIIERPGESTEDLGNTVIYLEAPPAMRPKLQPTKETIALQSRQFSPHVRVVPQGSKIEFSNQDPFSHNVFSKATQGPFDTDTYGRGKTKDNVFKQSGVYPIYCNVHPRMTAFVIAVNTPYYAQAGADGRFSIGNVPPGQYVMHVWHDRAMEQTTTITVADGGVGGLKYQLDARNYKYVQHKNKFGKDYVLNGDIY
jgi:plastocyanin